MVRDRVMARALPGSAAWLAIAFAAVVGPSGPLAAADSKGGLFVLPVDRAWPISDSDARLFEERLGIALGDTRRARALSERDIPEAERRQLPGDLSTCVTPACLKRLADGTTAERVLGTKLADDGGRATLFTILYDARSGAVLQRREWPAPVGEAAVTARRAAEVARWAVGEPPPPSLAPPPPPASPARPPVLDPGVLALDLARGEPESAQAQALLDELAARLGGRRTFQVLRRGDGRAPATHRAEVRIEQAHVSTRPHHLEHVREGTLAAALTIVELPSESVVFSARGRASLAAKSKKTNDAEIMSALVGDVVAQWVTAFDGQDTAFKLQKARESARDAREKKGSQ